METAGKSSLLKKEGDRLLKMGGYAEAVLLYTKALEAGGAVEAGDADQLGSAERGVLLSNRALARLKRNAPGDAEHALADARGAVEASPEYAKAHYRLGKALEVLGRAAEAEAAIDRAQELFELSEEGRDAAQQVIVPTMRMVMAEQEEAAAMAVGTAAAAPRPPPGESEGDGGGEGLAELNAREGEGSGSSGKEDDAEAAAAKALAAKLAATPVPDVAFTAATLAPFTGEDGGPIYIALRRKVYDVSTGADFYGPGNGYSKFAGKDASRAMAKMSFDPADVDERGCEELTEVQVKTLDDWIAKVRARVLCCVFLCFPSALLLADPVACHRAPSHLHAAVRQQVSDSRLGG